MTEDIIIFGAGGFGREVAWLIEEINKDKETWNILGFVDDLPEYAGKTVNGYDVLGTSEWIASYPKKIAVVCCLGDPKIRELKVTRMSVNPNVYFPNIISNYAHITSPTNIIGKGCVICASSIVTVNVCIGDFVLINLDCTIGHDTNISNYVTLHPSVNVSGGVKIGEFTEIGTGSQIIPLKEIGNNVIIGAGSVIISSIPDYATAVGSPAKVIKINGKKI